METPSFSAQDAAAIRANLDKYLSGDPISDPEAFFSQFTDDVHWVFSDNAPWSGMGALRSVKWCQTRSAEIIAERVEGSLDLAYARGTYSLVLDCGGETTVEFEGFFLSVHRRQQDGSWLIESLIQSD